MAEGLQRRIEYSDLKFARGTCQRKLSTSVVRK